MDLRKLFNEFQEHEKKYLSSICDNVYYVLKTLIPSQTLENQQLLAKEILTFEVSQEVKFKISCYIVGDTFYFIYFKNSITRSNISQSYLISQLSSQLSRSKYLQGESIPPITIEIIEFDRPKLLLFFAITQIRYRMNLIQELSNYKISESLILTSSWDTIISKLEDLTTKDAWSKLPKNKKYGMFLFTLEKSNSNTGGIKRLSEMLDCINADEILELL